MMMRELNKLKHVSYDNDSKVWELKVNCNVQINGMYIEINHQQLWGNHNRKNNTIIHNLDEINKRREWGKRLTLTSHDDDV
jgi:hypothetical protein